jgi:hypothetical protein
MKTPILSLALCILLACPVAGYATGTKPIHHHQIASADAAAKAHAKQLRQEGVSRSSADCVKYGCLGH